jgi:V/A-type H+-transporting ATPase subunit E
LESEGVDAGRKAGKKIEAEARKNADAIIAEANEKAEGIIAEAQKEAEKVEARMNSSLELAARDAIYMLREKLTKQVGIILKLNVEEALTDEDTLAHVLREVIPVYAKADAAGKLNAQINVSQSLKSRLLESTLRELSHSLRDKKAQVDVSHNLAEAGFECKIEGSTVEVTTESVTALLSEMIDPELQQFLEKAANAKD